MPQQGNDIPQDFTGALKAADLLVFFSDCTNAHQNEYLKWIGETKQPETRKTRIARAIQMISAKRAEEESRAKKKFTSM